ncbi:alpha/beta hydrolase [Niabella terrae]
MKIQNFLIRYFRMEIQFLARLSKRKAADRAFQIFCTPYTRMRADPALYRDAIPIRYRFGNKTVEGYRWHPEGQKKILIAHGFRSASANFVSLARQLVEKGYQVLAFDAPAHGSSAGRQLNALQYKEFIGALIRDFGPFDAYLSHSFDGLATAMNLAEMPHSAAVRAVFIAPAANSRVLTEVFFRELRIQDPLVQQYFYENIRRLSGRDIDWFSLQRCAGAIAARVLWVHDHDDDLTPVKDALELRQAALPNFSFILTRGLGHRRIYRDPHTIAAVLDFL